MKSWLLSLTLLGLLFTACDKDDDDDDHYHDDRQKPAAIVSVFPNPFRDTLTVTRVGEGEDTLRAQMYDMQGKLVSEVVKVKPANSIAFGMPVDTLKSGLYLLLVHEEELLRTFRVVKQ